MCWESQGLRRLLSSMSVTVGVHSPISCAELSPSSDPHSTLCALCILLTPPSLGKRQERKALLLPDSVEASVVPSRCSFSGPSTPHPQGSPSVKPESQKPTLILLMMVAHRILTLDRLIKSRTKAGRLRSREDIELGTEYRIQAASLADSCFCTGSLTI